MAIKLWVWLQFHSQLWSVSWLLGVGGGVMLGTPAPITAHLRHRPHIQVWTYSVSKTTGSSTSRLQYQWVMPQ